MPGVREDLILDISQASRSIDALEAQVASAFAGIAVTVDTAGIAQEISTATAAADTNVHVTADTTGVASEIAAATDVAPAEIDVHADTSQARAEVNKLDKDLDQARSSASGLGAALSGAALLAAVGGLFSLAEASSAVNEQLTGSEIVFGTLATDVQQFADQADRIGLANVQALQLSNTFGQLALSAGLSDSAVADFATTIVQRGADIASLRDIDLTQTLEALRSGLVGETEPLRNIGIFMNEALVASKAYELGLADLGAELTDQEKIQARYAIILEQSEIAAGNFALTQDGLANTQRQIRAEIADLAAESGALLEPSFLRLAGLTRDELLPSLAELAEEALPALGSILESLAPLLGTSLDLLIAAAPLLQVLADVLDAIPDPLLAGAAAWVAFNRAQRVADLVGLTSRVGRLSGGIDRMAGSFRGLDIAQKSVGVGVGVAALAGVVALATEAGAADGLSGLAGSIFEIGDALTGASSGRAAALSEELQALTAGLNTSESGGALIAVTRLREELEAVGDINDSLVSFGDKALFTDSGTRNAQERANALNAQVAALQSQARAEVEAGLETGRFTQAQIDATAAQVFREKPVSQIIRQLQLLEIEEAQAARAAELTIDKYDDVATAYIGVADALDRLRTEAPEVESAVTRIRHSGDTSEGSFLNLAVAIDTANLSTEGMADAAAALGTDTESLTGFVETLTDALDDFVDSAVSGLPTVSDVLGDVQGEVAEAASASAQAVRDAADERAQAVLDATNDRLAGSELGEGEAERIRKAGDDRAQAIRDAGEQEAAAIEARTSVSVSQFADGLRRQAEELADFRSDLDALTAGGFADVAGLLAEQGFEAGDAFADELANALDTGNLELIENLRGANQAFKDESTATVDFFRDVLGPEMISAAGLIASAITEGFGEDLDFEEKIRIAGELAKAELDPQAEQIAAIAATNGEAAARAYGEALKLDQETIDAGIEAGNAIAGIDTTTFKDSGRRIGEEIGDGIVDGFNAALLQRQSEVEEKAAQLVLAAEAAARAAGRIESPSKVWAEIGGYLADGLVVGLTAGSSRVAAAGVATVASAVPAFGTRSFTAASSSQGGLQRLHPEDIAALAAAVAAVRPNVFSAKVEAPPGATTEGSLIREMESFASIMLPGGKN